MEILRRGSEGPPVERWQHFLLGQGLLRKGVDAVFGPDTEQATREFQKRNVLEQDGAVGPLTYAAALHAGFDPGFSDPLGGTSGTDWPPRPVFQPLVSNADRAQHFGEFRYERVSPDADDIRIVDGWEAEHIVVVELPDVGGLAGSPADHRIRIHRRAADQLRALFDGWREAGLLPLLRSWEGSFVPRFVRGSKTTLSNHAWGTAFDVNAPWNQRGTVPALRSRDGSVRELVPLANDFGFYWGGHFTRRDGMHFEVARVLG